MDRMKSLTSFQELDALGEGLARDYVKQTHCWNSRCFDIEGFITDYLCLNIEYETFAEDDSSKIGFLSNGQDPLLVNRNGKIVPVIFPEDTIVIEKCLLKPEESCRRRFTLAHEAAHKVMERHVPMQTAACFHSDYNSQTQYSVEDMKRIFSLNETLTNRLGAAILMPLFLVEKAMKKFNEGRAVVFYEGGVFSQDTKMRVQKMADSMGVSFSAYINRLRELGLLECRPLDEYIHNGLLFGGEIVCQ